MSPRGQYALRQVGQALRAAGIVPGQTVLVHSSLMRLGTPGDCTAAELPARICAELRDAVGEDGTIVVPTFNFDFCRGSPYDPASTPSKGMGVLSEFVRRLPGARRSPHPMQSVAAIGPRAEEICARDTASSFDPGGPFATLVELEARGLLLGAPMQSFSLVHLVEERLEVPYRYWKTFSGPYGSPPSARSYRMYVRDLAIDPMLDLAPIEQLLARRGQLGGATAGAGWIRSFAVRDFLSVALEHVARDPEWLLRRRSETCGEPHA